MSDVRAGDFRPPSIADWVRHERLVAVVGSPLDTTLLAHNPLNAVTGGIWRVSGPEQSVIVKVVTDGSRHAGPSWWAASHEDRHWNSWRREVLAYREDLASMFQPDGVGAPALVELEETDDGAAILWLEDVHGRTGAELDVDDLVDLAGSLGRAQGRLAVDDGWDRPWLSLHFLREYSASKPTDDARWRDDDAWSHPRVVRHLGELREDLDTLRRDRGRLVGWSEACPQTLCHLDLWPPNVVRRDDGEFALLDWAFSGSGALGEDVANLVPDSVFDLLLPAELVEVLETRVEDAYLAGVREAGFTGDGRWVQLGIRAGAAKYHWLAERLLVDVDDTRVVYGGREVDADDVYAARAAGLRVLCRWAREARQLAGELGLDRLTPHG